MGGYILNAPLIANDNNGNPYLNLGRTLTTEGLLRIAQDNPSFTPVSHQTINDKSKADLLAKALICLQVSFLVIQVRLLTIEAMAQYLLFGLVDREKGSRLSIDSSRNPHSRARHLRAAHVRLLVRKAFGYPRPYGDRCYHAQ